MDRGRIRPYGPPLIAKFCLDPPLISKFFKYGLIFPGRIYGLRGDPPSGAVPKRTKFSDFFRAQRKNFFRHIFFKWMYALIRPQLGTPPLKKLGRYSLGGPPPNLGPVSMYAWTIAFLNAIVKQNRNFPLRHGAPRQLLFAKRTNLISSCCFCRV